MVLWCHCHFEHAGTLATPDEPGSAGGLLARLRNEHKLGQANLGQIDPTSETIKLATLGMRNIAATLLWKKANDYKMREDWTAFSATAEQIIKVQPNFPTVWNSRLEPVVQYLGRIRRLSRSLLLGDEGGALPAGWHRV